MGALTPVRFARDVLVAHRLYSRLPVTGRLGAWVGHDAGSLHRAAPHLPLVGWSVGGLTLLVALAVGTRWEPAVVAVAATATSVLLTGAFHEDGLADTADALGGPVDRERALAIMTDSRLGTYGVVALVLGLTGKVALLAQAAGAGTATLVAALLAGHVVSRLVPLGVMRALPYVGAVTGKAKPMAAQIGPGGLAVAAAWTAPAVVLVALIAGPGAAALALVVAVLVLLGALRLLRRRLDGFTGDALGATQQVSELAVLAVVVAA